MDPTARRELPRDEPAASGYSCVRRVVSMGFIRGATIESLIGALGAAGLLLGFILIYLARRGRRIDDHPLCRKCGYDLTGRAEGSDRCAECGADLSRKRAIRVGNRTPRRPLFWMGLSITAIFLVVTSAFAWVQFSRVDLMKHKPVWLLRSDASSLLSNQRVPAVAELTWRFTAGELTGAHIQAIISDALIHQADPNFPWNAEWDGLTNKFLLAGKISDADWITFVRQAMKLKLLTRRRIRAGDPMPVRLSQDGDRLPYGQRLIGVARPAFPPPFVEFEWLDAEISGVKLTNIPPRRVQYPELDNLYGARLDGLQTSRLAAGAHRLTAHVMVFVRNQNSTAEIASFKLSVDAEVQVFPAATDPSFLLVTDPGLKAEMQKAFRNVKVNVLGRMQRIEMNIHTKPPAGLAHRGYLRTADGREFAAGTISAGWGLWGFKGLMVRGDVGPAGSFDVILRPDFELVKESVVDPIWGDEIIFRNVPAINQSLLRTTGGQRPTTTSRPGG